MRVPLLGEVTKIFFMKASHRFHRPRLGIQGLAQFPIAPPPGGHAREIHESDLHASQNGYFSRCLDDV